MPDYDLYSGFVNRRIEQGKSRSWFADYLDYSIGFTTRGCFRKCAFCVNKKYDHAFKHSPVSEFVDDTRPYIYLWDDNFLAYPKWESVLDELEATGKPYQFRQGLDIRLLNQKKAQRLSTARYIGDFIFAFDHIEDREIIERGLNTWRRYTVRGTRLYVLCAYESQDAADIESVFERISVLMKYGCLPYIMRYEDYKTSRWRSLYVNIARWCNQPQFFKKKSFREFCKANQIYHRNKATKCAALRSMEEFETAHPDIAARYFDLKYEEQNMLYRFGRPYFLNPSEEVAALQRDAWGSVKSGTVSKWDALRMYFDKELDVSWAQRYSSEDYSSEISTLFSIIEEASFDDLFGIVASSDFDEFVTPENIPQFSSLDSAFMSAYVLSRLDEQLSYEGLGVYLSGDGVRKDPIANKKYGENHGKTAALFDLALVTRENGVLGFRSTRFGDLFCDLSEEGKRLMAAKLSLRIPIVRKMLVDARNERVSLGDYMRILAQSTQKRRRPNVLALLDCISEGIVEGDASIRAALGNIGREL